MANLANVINQGTATNAAQADRLGQIMTQGAVMERQGVRDAMEVKKFNLQKQLMIDQKGDALFATLEFKHNQRAKAKAGWDKLRQEAQQVQMEDMSPEEKLAFEQGEDGWSIAVEETGDEKLARLRYETENSELAAMLNQYVEDPRVAAIIGQYTYDAEKKKSTFLDKEALEAMTDDQRAMYVGRITALGKAQRQRGEAQAAASHQADLQKIIMKEKAEAAYDTTGALQQYPSSVALNKNQYAANFADSGRKASEVEKFWAKDIAEFEPRTKLLQKETSDQFRDTLSSIFSTWAPEGKWQGGDVKDLQESVADLNWDSYIRTETDKKVLKNFRQAVASGDALRIGAFVNSMKEFMQPRSAAPQVTLESR